MASIHDLVGLLTLLCRAEHRQAIGQGLFQVEIFQHFDVDCRGEIGESCLSDGLKRLGIFLTTAETNTFFKRFKPNEKGMVSFNSFLGTLGVSFF